MSGLFAAWLSKPHQYCAETHRQSPLVTLSVEIQCHIIYSSLNSPLSASFSMLLVSFSLFSCHLIHFLFPNSQICCLPSSFLSFCLYFHTFLFLFCVCYLSCFLSLSFFISFSPTFSSLCFSLFLPLLFCQILSFTSFPLFPFPSFLRCAVRPRQQGELHRRPRGWYGRLHRILGQLPQTVELKHLSRKG